MLKLFLLLLVSTFDTNASDALSVDLIRSVDVKIVLSDMDGTLLNSFHKVTEESINAIKTLQSSGILFFPATGRTRTSMVNVAGTSFVNLFGDNPLKIPGVYSQGLMVYGRNGELIYERILENDVIEKVENFCSDENIALLAYAGDQIFCRQQDVNTRKVCDYGDRLPEEVPSGLKSLLNNGILVNKLILLGSQQKLLSIRDSLELVVENIATLTTAVPGMLEVLPFGASKGVGVLKLLQHFDLPTDNCIAFGDGENDIEMLQFVKVGVAMQNAKPLLKSIANGITLSNDEDGVAHGIKLILQSMEKNTLVLPMQSNCVE